MGEAALCGRAVLWAAGLCAVALGSALLAVLPDDRERVNAGLAGGAALGMFVTVAWHAVAACGSW